MSRIRRNAGIRHPADCAPSGVAQTSCLLSHVPRRERPYSGRAYRHRRNCHVALMSQWSDNLCNSPLAHERRSITGWKPVLPLRSKKAYVGSAVRRTARTFLPDSPLLSAVGTVDNSPVRKRREKGGANRTALNVQHPPTPEPEEPFFLVTRECRIRQEAGYPPQPIARLFPLEIMQKVR